MTPIIRMDENSFRVPDKMQQSNISRKPLTDMTNSRKPLPKKNKPSEKHPSGYKVPEKAAPPKAARKPLGDLTNLNKPRAQNKSSKKNCTENLSAVSKEQAHSFVSGEGFLHNHNDCIKAHRQSMTMSLDYFYETVALKRDFEPVLTPRLPQVSELEIDDTLMEIKEMEVDTFDTCAPRSPQAPRSPGSPCWSTDFDNFKFSPLKLKGSP